jgi:hypothetical protein
MRNLVGCPTALCLKRSISDLFNKEKKELVLGNGITIAVLLSLAKSLFLLA